MRITLCVSTLLRSTGYTDVASRKFLQYLCGGIVLGNLLENKAFRGFSLRRQLFDELAVLHPSWGLYGHSPSARDSGTMPLDLIGNSP